MLIGRVKIDIKIEGRALIPVLFTMLILTISMIVSVYKQLTL